MIYIVSFAILYGLLPFLLFLFVKDKIENKIRGIIPFTVLVFFSAIYEIIFQLFLDGM